MINARDRPERTVLPMVEKASLAMTTRSRDGALHMLAAAMAAAVSLHWATPVGGQQAPPNFIIPVAKQVPAISFADERGRVLGLNDFRGRTVLLNIWATWCGPCRKEMPTLDRLQARLGSERFQVVALSIDRGGAAAVQRFYAEIGVRQLAFFIDSTGRAGGALGLIGLPGTLLIDPEGREIGRLIGPAEWDSPEMIAFLQSRIAQPGARRASRLQPAEGAKETMQ
jgi:thiol-disulfide isomerase/thioredoxin